MPSLKHAIISYIPVLHRGYKQLFDAYPDADIYVLGPKMIAQFDQLRKELRALQPDEVVAALNGWGRSAQVLTPDVFASLEKTYEKLIFSDEDVSRALADKTTVKTIFEPVFLRWDRRAIESKQDLIAVDHTTSTDATDRDLMRQAVQLGEKSSNLYRRMGALIVTSTAQVISGFNSAQPTVYTSWIEGDPRNNARRGESTDVTLDIHAEAMAIATAAKQGVMLQNAHMYIVDFPCPTCAKLIANSGITKLYFARGYAVLDGEAVLRANGIELILVEGVELDNDNDPTLWVPYPQKP